MLVNMSTSHRPPAGLFGTPIVPAPAAVKGSACGPLRALDRFGREHGLTIMTGGLTPPQSVLSCSVSTPHMEIRIMQNKAPESRGGAEPFETPPHRTADGPDGQR